MKALHAIHVLTLALSLWQPPRCATWEVMPAAPVGHQPTCMDAYSFAPYVLVESPLYTAVIDGEKRTCVWITYRVRAEDVEPDNDARRVWWCPEELRDYCLEAEDYRGSSRDRGHLRSVQMSRGSAHIHDIHLTAVIIPELPELNRGAIAQLEGEICELATEHGWCQVTITLLHDDDADVMPNADEDHDIPSQIIYLIQSPAGERTETFDNEDEDDRP